MRKRCGAAFLCIFLCFCLFIAGRTTPENAPNLQEIVPVQAALHEAAADWGTDYFPNIEKWTEEAELIRQEEPASGEPVFQLYAKAAVLMDADSGRVLYAKDADTHMPNANTTKIMTAILAIESGRMEETATVSAYAASQPKVRLGMQAEDTFYIRDLLYSLMLESHNDAAVVIAEHIGGSVEGFAAMMNDKAKEIGCRDTYFITPNGLDAQDETGVHGTTAADLALMMSYCLKNETFLEITRTASYSFSNAGGTRQYSANNHNAFLGMMEGALTGKTGFTGNAGYCYVGALRQDERTFVVALLACGWPNNKSYKWADTKELMRYALEQYQYQEVFEHGKVLKEIPVLDAKPKDWKLYQETYVKPEISDNTLKVLKKESEQVTVVYDLPKVLTAPLRAGTKIGEVRYFLKEECIKAYPITITDSVEKLEENWYVTYILRQFFLPG